MLLKEAGIEKAVDSQNYDLNSFEICELCSDLLPEDQQPILRCGHLFCEGCIRKYINDQVQSLKI